MIPSGHGIWSLALPRSPARREAAQPPGVRAGLLATKGSHRGRQGRRGDGNCNSRTVRPDCIGIRTSASIQRGTDPDRILGETVKRLKVTLGVMAAVAFAASMQVEGHSGEVGADGCHAGGESYHCHFRISKSTRIDPDPPGTPVHKIRKADRRPGRRQVMPEVHRPNSPNMPEGVAKVIDGDTIEIAGNRIRLHGIDALEGRQRCRRADGTSWACGRDAARALRGMIAGGRVSCAVHRRDQYGRAVATCYANGVDLNGWMVSQGHALAYRRYSRRYVGEEQSARRARKGMHAGEYEPPRSWRRRNPRRRDR